MLQRRKDMIENLRIVAVAVKGGVDGSVTKVDGSRAAGRSDDLVRDVAVGTSNDYMEILAPLAIVLCVVGGDRTAPKDTPGASTISINLST